MIGSLILLTSKRVLNNMYIVIILLPFFVLNVSILQSKQVYTTWPTQSGHISDKTIQNISKKLHTQYGLELIGVGGGLSHTITNIFMDLSTKQPTTLENARKQMLDILELCIQEINNHITWAPYFDEYPVTKNSISIYLHMVNKKGGELPLGTFNVVGWSYNRLWYNVSREKWAPYLLEETYEEAKAIVEAERALQEQ